MATVGELRALLEGKSDTDIVEIASVPNYVLNIKPAEAPVAENVSEAVSEVVAEAPVEEVPAE